MIMVLPIALALAAVPAPAVDFVRPSDVALQDSLNELEVCRSFDPTGCWSPKRAYKVHGANCIPIAFNDERPAIACRVDMTLTYEDPAREATRYHDSCIRFSKREIEDGRPEWEVIQRRNLPCEIPSMLTKDPNPEPGKAQIERALVGMMTCHDDDGITDCVAPPEAARLEKFRCKPIRPGEEYQARVACRVTGDMRYAGGRLAHQFSHMCLRLDRITTADESPAYWVAISIPQDVPCEIR